MRCVESPIRVASQGCRGADLVCVSASGAGGRVQIVVQLSDEAPAARVPPSVECLERFIGELRERIGPARKYASARRDSAVFRTMYWTGLRCSEFMALDAGDLHWDRGPEGRPHIGSATAWGSEPRSNECWVTGKSEQRCAM